ncbi:MAG: VanZ family protein [Lentisphaeria bacterium]|jgi:VanZ family protein
MHIPPRLRWGLLAGYAGTVALLSLLPPRAFHVTPPRIPHLDKLVHAGMYGILAVLLCWSLALRRHEPRKLLAILAAVAGYGLLLELGQFGLTGGQRAFELADALANLTGGAVMAALWLLLHRPPPPA